MRADARKNYDHLLDVAREVMTRQGADASMRDIARKADVGLATLLRHFPSREALLEILLHNTFDRLTAQAAELEESSSPQDALGLWFRDCIALAHEYQGVTTMLMSAIEDPASALHGSCVRMREAGTRLLTRAQDAGVARGDVDGTDLFALISALAWLSDQPASASRAEHLVELFASAILTDHVGATSS